MQGVSKVMRRTSYCSSVKRLYCQHVHKSATKGFTIEGTNLYESGRPSYTEESIAKIRDIAELSSTKSNLVLELGAGTGKFTSSFLAYSKHHKILPYIRYIATEPSDGFRKLLEDKYINSDYSGSLEVLNGLGSSIPAESKSLDCGAFNILLQYMINGFDFPNLSPQ